jgi:hypothetical protein
LVKDGEPFDVTHPRLGAALAALVIALCATPAAALFEKAGQWAPCSNLFQLDPGLVEVCVRHLWHVNRFADTEPMTDDPTVANG